jgi:hypothetical protein
MKAITITPLLFLAAAGTTPAMANYFSNPHLNIIRNIGSVPSPTPQDVRENRVPQLAENDRSGTNEKVADTAKTGKTEQAHQIRIGESDR